MQYYSQDFVTQRQVGVIKANEREPRGVGIEHFELPRARTLRTEAAAPHAPTPLDAKWTGL